VKNPASPSAPSPEKLPGTLARLDDVGVASEHASLKVSLGAVPRRWGHVTATVPPGQARHLISVSGILGSVITGAAAAVVTLHASTKLAVPAYAELALALVAAVLITVCNLTGASKQATAQASGMTAQQSREITGPAEPGPVPDP
jgi:hypothetical protein